MPGSPSGDPPPADAAWEDDPLVILQPAARPPAIHHFDRLQAVALMLAVLAVIVAPIGYFVIREGVQDPIFAELDGWAVPGWAAGKHVDGAFGSRFCIRECRYRERTWESSRGSEETNRAYTAAAAARDWRPSGIKGCAATGVDGVQTCWQRDEYVLNLWVRPPVCDLKPTRPQVGPSAAPTTPGAPGCAASIATVKVFNRVAYPDRPAEVG